MGLFKCNKPELQAKYFVISSEPLGDDLKVAPEWGKREKSPFIEHTNWLSSAKWIALKTK